MKINERAGKFAPDWIELYDKKTGLACMTAAEHFGLSLTPTIRNPITVQCDDLTLRDYQKEPIDELMHKSYGLLRAFTAFGKCHKK